MEEKKNHSRGEENGVDRDGGDMRPDREAQHMEQEVRPAGVEKAAGESGASRPAEEPASDTGGEGCDRQGEQDPAGQEAAGEGGGPGAGADRSSGEKTEGGRAAADPSSLADRKAQEDQEVQDSAEKETAAEIDGDRSGADKAGKDPGTPFGGDTKGAVPNPEQAGKADTQSPVPRIKGDEEESSSRREAPAPEPGSAAPAPAPPAADAAAPGAGKILRAAGEKLIPLFGRVPLVNRIPFRRLGAKRTALGTIACLLMLTTALTLLAVNAWPTNMDAGSVLTPLHPTKKPASKPKPLTLTLTHGEKEWKADLRKMGYDGKHPSTLDRKEWEAWVADVKREVDDPAQNARTERLGAAITPERMGWLLDVEELEKWPREIGDKANGIHAVPLVSDAPEVTAEDLQRVDGRLIGHYVTYYNPGNVNRTTNLRLSTQAIHNRVLNPGEVFSFNKTVGQRTAARGYQSATIIVKGEYDEGLGGGICQTSSTLYNSVDNAGLAIVARYSHSKEVTYVPKGRDATVAWYGPDFRFRNNLSKPVLIRTGMGGGKQTINVYTVPGTYHSPRGVQSAPTKVEDMVPAR